MRQQERIVVFSGTTEGREYSERLSADRIFHIVCVATDYGKEVMKPSPYADIRVGRLDADEMAELFQTERITKVVDATHPFAAEVTENIRAAIEMVALDTDGRQMSQTVEKTSGTSSKHIVYKRISREINSLNNISRSIRCEDMAEAAEFLNGVDGNILLTTGSKDLKRFTAGSDDAFRKRLFARVLPAVESLEICAECGMARSHIIAMQGPFSVGMNVEMLRQHQIRWLVTKNTGKTGGFPEKLRAAEIAGCGCVVIDQPGGTGTIFVDRPLIIKCAEDSRRKTENDKEGGALFETVSVARATSGLNDRPYLEVTLCGIGAGNEAEMTVVVQRAIQSADILLGAKRVLGERKGKLDTQAVYRAEDILAYIRDFVTAPRQRDQYRICVLFSGDTGFYSGCASVYKVLCEEKERGGFFGCVTILPGVSSVSMLSAKIGVPYQDAVLFSIHGRPEEIWSKELSAMLCQPPDCRQIGYPLAQEEREKKNKIIFMLLSGKKDLEEIQLLLLDCGQDQAEVSVGYNLFLEDEKVVRTTAGDLQTEDFAEGLFTVCIVVKDRRSDVANDRIVPPEELGGTQTDHKNLAMADSRPENALNNERILSNTDLPEARIPIMHLPDTAFLRQPKLPMTKQEIRSIVFSKLELTGDAVFYDVGSGTGSIAVTAAASQGALAGAGSLRVLAFERKKEACEVIRQNADHLGAKTVSVFCGEAPDIFDEVPSGLKKPTHAFIGGSGGRLEEIYTALIRRNPAIRIVITAITTETVQECYRLREAYGLDAIEILQVNIARERALGSCHTMERGRDVYVFCI